MLSVLYKSIRPDHTSHALFFSPPFVSFISKIKMTVLNKLNVLMVGTGEYTTGFVNGGASKSDKKVCLTLQMQHIFSGQIH